MIAQISGVVAAAGPTWVVVEVGGIGLHALCTPNTAVTARTGEPITLHTSLIVREDSLTLYGFCSPGEREAFVLAQSASGVGPKLALAIVSVLSPAEFASAVQREDLSRLCAVPGIGRKGAQKLVIELRDKVAALGLSDEPPRPIADRPVWRDQVAEGLQGLGWSPRDAEAACEKVAPLAESDPDVAIAVLMRAALASLARS